MREFIKKIPAGNMMVPLLISSILATFWPGIFHFGEFTEALFSTKAIKTLIGLNILASGDQIDFRNMTKIFKRAGVLAFSRILTGLLMVYVVSLIFGREGIFGISVLALVCASLNHNNSVFISLNLNYGDKFDQALPGFTSLISGPTISMLVLGMSGIADIPLRAMIDCILPVVIGAIVGNISKDFAGVLSNSQKVFIPFLGISMGSAINLKDIYRAGFSGLILALMVLIFIGLATSMADIIINKKSGFVGWAIATTGANAVAVPAIIASIDPSWQAYVGIATAQVAASAVITIILTPLLTAFWAKRFNKTY